MDTDQIQFNTGVIQPVDCLKEGFALIKERYWLFFGITAVGMLIGAAFAIVLMGPMMCGIYFCLFGHMRGETVKFENLFRGFDYFGQSVIATLIQVIPVILLVVPLYIMMLFGMFASLSMGGPDRGASAAGLFFLPIALIILLLVVVNVILGVLFIFVFPLIVDRKLSAVDALKTSLKAVMANLSSVLLLFIMNAALAFVGVLFCYVGAFFVLPITLASQATAFRKIFPETRSV